MYKRGWFIRQSMPTVSNTSHMQFLLLLIGSVMLKSVNDDCFSRQKRSILRSACSAHSGRYSVCLSFLLVLSALPGNSIFRNQFFALVGFHRVDSSLLFLHSCPVRFLPPSGEEQTSAPLN